ncbi:uncharacterized protein G2W53_034104 [Senna tora]|uniref:Uncharacterized protein n=1 Tax=Senna tora TaxID=362788 RepID=A0A834SYR0_9FABA|nr:uncharacterized protein G2W53_034104 [Senna tora]
MGARGFRVAGIACARLPPSPFGGRVGFPSSAPIGFLSAYR